MAIRNVQKWSRYLKRTAFVATKNRLIRQATNWGDLSHKKKKSPKMIQRWEELDRSLERFKIANKTAHIPSPGFKILIKIVAETTLNNVQARKKLSAEKFFKARQVTVNLLNLWNTAFRMRSAAEKKHGKNIPIQVQERVNAFESEKVIPLLYKLEKICGKKLTVQITEEIIQLGRITSELSD